MKTQYHYDETYDEFTLTPTGNGNQITLTEEPDGQLRWKVEIDDFGYVLGALIRLREKVKAQRASNSGIERPPPPASAPQAVPASLPIEPLVLPGVEPDRLRRWPLGALKFDSCLEKREISGLFGEHWVVAEIHGDPALAEFATEAEANVFLKNQATTVLAFEAGHHDLLTETFPYMEVKLVGLEIQIAGRGHAVVRHFCRGGDANVLGSDWTVLGPDDTVLPTGERVPTVRREIVTTELRTFPRFQPSEHADASIVVVGEARVTLHALVQIWRDDQRGPPALYDWPNLKVPPPGPVRDALLRRERDR